MAKYRLSYFQTFVGDGIEIQFQKKNFVHILNIHIKTK